MRRRRDAKRGASKIRPGYLALAGLVLTLVIGLGIWRAWPQKGAAEEAFLSFPNQTVFRDDQLWEAYRFAVANPQGVLDYMPCYCGCVYHGDADNRDCYIDGFTREGKPIYDPHGAGCSVCIAITLDVQNRLQQGLSFPAIRAAVEANYSGLGPGTNTPWPPS